MQKTTIKRNILLGKIILSSSDHNQLLKNAYCKFKLQMGVQQFFMSVLLEKLIKDSTMLSHSLSVPNFNH